MMRLVVSGRQVIQEQTSLSLQALSQVLLLLSSMETNLSLLKNSLAPRLLEPLEDGTTISAILDTLLLTGLKCADLTSEGMVAMLSLLRLYTKQATSMSGSTPPRTESPTSLM